MGVMPPYYLRLKDGARMLLEDDLAEVGRQVRTTRLDPSYAPRRPQGAWAGDWTVLETLDLEEPELSRYRKIRRLAEKHGRLRDENMRNNDKYILELRKAFGPP